jgi:hypothetical protein
VRLIAMCNALWQCEKLQKYRRTRSTDSKSRSKSQVTW